MQSEYALPVRVGSKLLMKCTKTECEYFNRKVFDRLDKVKDMEDKYELADSASLTNDPAYHEYGPLGVIACAQKIHSKFLADHEWPGLASKLSHIESAQSNSVQTKGKFTCYHCGEDGHIKPNYPKLQADVPKNNERQKERRPLAAWKTVRPNDIRKKFVDENKVEWNFCTKCMPTPSVYVLDRQKCQISIGTSGGPPPICKYSS
jgi:DNA-directed RNA polymerase subunit M/transcription elongation factor TFIIS